MPLLVMLSCSDGSNLIMQSQLEEPAADHTLGSLPDDMLLHVFSVLGRIIGLKAR